MPEPVYRVTRREDGVREIPPVQPVRLLTPADFSECVSLDVAELLVGELQEFVGARPERRRRDRVERCLEVRLRFLEKRQFLRDETLLVHERGS